MVNKNLCLKCFMQSRQKWVGEGFDRTAHVGYFEDEWEQGRRACDYRDSCNYKDGNTVPAATSVSISKPIPQCCPYLLEQILVEQKDA